MFQIPDKMICALAANRSKQLLFWIYCKDNAFPPLSSNLLLPEQDRISLQVLIYFISTEFVITLIIDKRIITLIMIIKRLASFWTQSCGGTYKITVVCLSVCLSVCPSLISLVFFSGMRHFFPDFFAQKQKNGIFKNWQSPFF